MDQAIKQALLDRFRSYLDGLDDGACGQTPVFPDEGDEAADLLSVFVEIAALRNETRVQSRLTKDAIDQFRAVFDTLNTSQATLEHELKEARARENEQSRATLRPLLLEIIDVRDRLSAGVASLPPRTAGPWWERWLRKTSSSDPWREGMVMTLRRLDQALADRRVMPITTVGRLFQPSHARAVSTIDDPSVAEGMVVVELRAGFTWEDEVLRPAEVAVARRPNTTDVNRGDAS